MANDKKSKNQEGTLQSELFKLRQQLVELHKDKMHGELKQGHKIKELKKKIARVLTKINQLKK